MTKILFGYNQLLCAGALVEERRFSLSLFEDLNRFIEAVVLYDKVAFLGEYDLPSIPLYNELAKEGVFEKFTDRDLRANISTSKAKKLFYANMQDIFGIDAASFRDTRPEALLDLRISPNSFDQASYNALFGQVITCDKRDGYDLAALGDWLKKNMLDTRDRGGHFYYVARALVYSSVAEASGMDYAPDFLRLPITALSFSKANPPISKVIYDALAEKLHSEIEALALLGMPVSIFIPPLTAKILEKTPPPKDFAIEILALREAFEKFRNTYGEFIELLRDPEVSLKEKIAAKERLFNSITGIIEKDQGGHALNLRTVWDKLISSQLGDSGVSAKLSLSGMVSVLLDQLLQEHTKGRAKALFDLWVDTVNMKNYGRLIETAFKTEVDSRELDETKKYSSAIRSMIRAAREAGVRDVAK